MEDRYLFRGERIDNREWVEGMPFEIEGKTMMLIRDDENFLRTHYLDENMWIAEIYCVEVDPSTICRCIGSRDKNSKLIWENDILSGHIDDGFPEDETRKRVVWHENGWCTNEPGCDDYEELDDFDSENFEVIGNMIDNPELVEE